MKVKSIKIVDSEKDTTHQEQDYNIYIDTDSVFFSAVPLLNIRFNSWKNEDDTTIAKYVNDIAQESQDFLNKFYDIFASKLFNISKHRFEIKKEYVAKAGLWVAKKRYAQWIIMNNGLPVDKLDVKGLDVKRSSFPKAFQEIMSTVLIDILKGKAEDEITNKVLEFKKNMHSLPIVQIAKNSAVKGMDKYTPKGKRNLFHIMKGTPAHVKAAILYNDLLIHFNVAFNYQPMRAGDKIKWVYLKNNPFGIDGLAFTGYSDPKEILDLLEKYTDRDRLFEAELHYKLQDFYTAVGWGHILSTEKQASKFFKF